VLLCLRCILACTIDTSLWVIKSHLHLHGSTELPSLDWAGCAFAGLSQRPFKSSRSALANKKNSSALNNFLFSVTSSSVLQNEHCGIFLYTMSCVFCFLCVCVCETNFIDSFLLSICCSSSWRFRFFVQVICLTLKSDGLRTNYNIIQDSHVLL
jgi:hypothetical protein